MKVSITACEGYEKEQVTSALQELLAPLGGLCWVKPGMKIAIKANLVSMLKPEAAATTHPALLTALMKMLVQRGAEVTLGDSPGGLYTRVYLERVYAITGMKEAVKAAGAKNQALSHSFPPSRFFFLSYHRFPGNANSNLYTKNLEILVKRQVVPKALP